MDKADYGKKTILYLITQSELGGAQRYVFDLAKNLKNEFNIKVAFGEPDGNGELAGLLDQVGIEYYVLPHLVRAISPINDLRALFEIIKLIKKIKPDVIHLNSSKISILGSLAVRITRSMIHVPRSTLYTVHGWVFNEPLPVWQKLFYKYAEKLTARWKDKLICVSEFDRQVALKEKIAAAEKLITIHNGIEPINFLPREDALNFLNTKYQIPNTKYIIGSIGNFYKSKGFEHLIKAVKKLATSYELQVTLIIIGEGKARKNLEKLIKNLKLENNVFLVGKIDSAAELLKAFDIYICPSVKEGLSYTLLEARQAGLPIIATNVGGNPELIETGGQNLLIQPADPEILAHTVQQIINSGKLYSNLPAENKSATEFTLNRMLTETKKLY